jgi:uncharacterized C2H2 Zn-finger protein
MATCPYCGEEFKDKTQEGIHRSKTHINQEPIPKTSKTRNKNKNKIETWTQNNKRNIK